MKSTILNFLLCVCFCSALVFQSCEEDDGPEPLVANAGEDFTAAPLTTVELDGTASTPADQIQYEWEYNGPVAEDQISLQGQFTGTPSFIPPKNGVYYFTLTITRGSEFMTDQIVVTVEGFITLVTLSEQMNLADIEPDPTKPDYKLSEILTLSASNALVANTQGTNGIIVECSEAAGIVVTGGVQNIHGVKFSSPTGWKGILLQGGYTTLDLTTIEKGGKSLFQNATETAAITANGGTLNLINSTFTGTTGYDVLLENNSTHTTSGNTFSSARPIKGPIQLVSGYPYNNFPGSYDYITLTTPGAGTFVTSAVNSEFRFVNGRKYYIDGDFTASSLLTIESGATIYMKENAGIVSGQGSYINAGSSSKATIDGLNSSSWKGIAFAGVTTHTVNGLIIKNAGNAVFNTGALTTDVKAALHVTNSSATFQHIEIHNSQGYGISWTSPDSPPAMTNCTFLEGASASVRIPYYLVHYLLRQNHNNAFTLGAGIPAVELFGNSGMHSGTVWRSLNGNNFYLATTNIVLSANLTLSAGVKVRFAANRSMTGAGTLSAVGSVDAPIVLEGPADSPGSWSGILLDGLFNIEHCQIKNGGQSLMFGATETAALVIKYNGVVNASNFTFKNNIVTGSTGLGVLIEVGGKDPGITDPANNNSYSNNTAGNTLKK